MKYELRHLKLEDAKDLAVAANNSNVARYLRDVFPHPYTMQDAINYINYATGDPDEIVYGIIVDEKVCGCISAKFRGDVYSKSCELGYWLGEKHWGQGIMTAAAKEFCSFIFENYDIYRIDAEIFTDNIGSRKVLEKAGFELEGVHKQKVYKNGRFSDEAVFALLRG